MRLRSLQCLRAVAAISVVLYHAGVYVGLYTGDLTFARLFDGFGTVGVQIFFALSGTLMAGLVQRGGEPSRFLLHRVLRIFPILWLAALVRMAVGVAGPDGTMVDPLAMVLAPIGERRFPLGVEWTLVYEATFYVALGLLLLLRLGRHVRAIAAAWLVAIIAYSLWRGSSYTPQLPAEPVSLLASQHSAAFAFGLLLQGVPAGWRLRRWALPGAVVLAILSNLPAMEPVWLVLVGAACALLVAWVASFATLPRGFDALARLGDASFVIYLIHVPVLTVTLPLVARWPVSVVFPAEVALVLAAGLLLSGIDLPLYRFLRRRCDAAGPRSRALACAGFLAVVAATLVLADTDALTRPALPPALAQLGGTADVSAALAAAGFSRDADLRGAVDRLPSGGQRGAAEGWVSDPHDKLNRSAILLVVSGQAVALLPPRGYRADLLRVLGRDSDLAPNAFLQMVQAPACPAGATRSTIAISWRRRTFRPLQIALARRRSPAIAAIYQRGEFLAWEAHF